MNGQVGAIFDLVIWLRFVVTVFGMLLVNNLSLLHWIRFGVTIELTQNDNLVKIFMLFNARYKISNSNGFNVFINNILMLK